MKLFESSQDQYESTAKIVDNTLVLSLPGAKSPVVWRMDLSEIKSAAFEVQQEEDLYLLMMKTPKGAAQKIAPFETRDGAMKALMATSTAMGQASQRATVSVPANDGIPLAIAAPPRKNGKGSQILMGIIGIILLLGFLFTMTQMGPRTSSSLGDGSSSLAAAGTGTAPGGVPVSADDFLRNR